MYNKKKPETSGVDAKDRKSTRETWKGYLQLIRKFWTDWEETYQYLHSTYLNNKKGIVANCHYVRSATAAWGDKEVRMACEGIQNATRPGKGSGAFIKACQTSKMRLQIQCWLNGPGAAHYMEPQISSL